MSETTEGARLMLTDTMWAIKGRWDNGREFFYCGTFLRRKDAIEDHTAKAGCSWQQRYRRGDRVVKVTITEQG